MHHAVTQSLHMRMTYDNFVDINYHEKPKILSSITSMKTHTKGAKQRVEFLRKFCKKKIK